MSRARLFKVVWPCIILSLVMFIIGCGGGGGGSSSVTPEELTTINVTGKILDSSNNPIPGATVTITSDPVVVITNQWGEFSAKVAPGEHTITITMGTETLYRNTFTAPEGSHIALGTLTPNYPDSSGDKQAPTIPASAIATAASSSQINLNWSPSTDNAGVTSYRIYRNGTQLPNTVTGTTYSDTGLSSSTQYCYTVSAGDAAGNWSAQSAQSCATTLAAGSSGDTQAPATPGSPTATTASSSQINLSWGASTDNIGVTGYKLYRGGVFLKQVSGTSATDTSLSSSTQYCYTISAGDAAGNWSAQSSQSCATTQAGGGTGDTQIPSVPGSVIATVVSSSQVNLGWGPSTDNIGVTGYRVYRSGVYLKQVSGTSTTDTGLSASTHYCYTVCAGDAAGNWSAQSSQSAQSCATTQASSDTTPPTVASTSPKSNASFVSTNTAISATFSEGINPSSIDASCIAVTMGTSGLLIPGTITCNSPTIVFTPATKLVYGTTYNVTIKSGTSGIKDLAGNALSSDYSWSFTTIYSGGIPELLMQFINTPTQSNYNTLMSAIAATGTAKESYLYKAMGELLDIFNSTESKQILSDFGLPSDIGFDTDFEQLKQLDLNTMAYTYLMHSPNLYLPSSQALLLETENRLTQVDNLLAQADGIDLSLNFGPLDTVRFDSTDIKVFRAMTNLLKAYFVYLQSLNYTITNYSVTYNSQPYDLRYLLTHDAVHVADGETDRAMMQQVWMQVLNNNTSLLTYTDRSATSKLAEFRTTLLNAFGFYESAVTDIENMTQQQRRGRYNNAFNLDSDYEVAFAKVIWDQAITSFVGCMNNTSTQFIIPRSVQTNEIMIAGGDGFYYPEDIYDVYLDMYLPNSSGSQITIYNLLALGTGKTPRDIIYEINALPADVDYNPYILYLSSSPSLTNLADILWDEFVEGFNVPAATITIDGNSSDWNSVPVLYTRGTSTYKIARDPGNNLYLFIQSTYIHPGSGVNWDWRSSIYLSSTYGIYGQSNWDYTNTQCSIYGSSSVSPNFATSYYSSPSASSQIMLFSDGSLGLEMRVDLLSLLLKQGALNNFLVSEYSNSSGTNNWYGKVIKFLPEMP